MSLDWQVLQALIDAAPDGVVVCDARAHGFPAIYSNGSFESITGYSAANFQGRDIEILLGDAPFQDGSTTLRAALSEGMPCRVVLRCQRKDGTSFLNEVQVLPIRATDGQLTHLASFHRIVGDAGVSAEAPIDPMLNTQRMLAYVREDKLTGLLRRSYFEDLIHRDFALAQRDGKALTICVFGVDYADAYREVFGVAGAEQTFKRVARTISACFRRNSDLCARWEEPEVIAASMTTPLDKAGELADLVISRVRDLAIHHPRAVGSRYVTISAGIVAETPGRDATAEQFIARALQALAQVRNQGAQRISRSA